MVEDSFPSPPDQTPRTPTRVQRFLDGLPLAFLILGIVASIPALNPPLPDTVADISPEDRLAYKLGQAMVPVTLYALAGLSWFLRRRSMKSK